MKNSYYIIPFIASLVFLALPIVAWAIEIPNPLKAQTFEELVGAIIDIIFKLALVVAPLMIVIAGLLFVTGGGSPESVQKAKNIVLYTVIGLAVILLAESILAVLEELLKPVL